MNTFETKDVALAVFLKLQGNYCIGTIPANNKYKPHERLWMFEDNELLRSYVNQFEEGDPTVPVKQAFHSYRILKNLLNDKDE